MVQKHPLYKWSRNDKNSNEWKTIKGSKSISFNEEFSILIKNKIEKNDKIITGIMSLNDNNNSLLYGYINYNGNKIDKEKKSIKYGNIYGNIVGQVITCILNDKNKSIQFLLNNKEQGIAFNQINKARTKIFPAISFNSKDCKVILVQRSTPFTPPASDVTSNSM